MEKVDVVLGEVSVVLEGVAVVLGVVSYTLEHRHYKTAP